MRPSNALHARTTFSTVHAGAGAEGEVGGAADDDDDDAPHVNNPMWGFNLGAGVTPSLCWGFAFARCTSKDERTRVTASDPFSANRAVRDSLVSDADIG